MDAVARGDPAPPPPPARAPKEGDGSYLNSSGHLRSLTSCAYPVLVGLSASEFAKFIIFSARPHCFLVNVSVIIGLIPVITVGVCQLGADMQLSFNWCLIQNWWTDCFMSSSVSVNVYFFTAPKPTHQIFINVKYRISKFFSQLYRAYWCYQSLLFTNWCTIELL